MELSTEGQRDYARYLWGFLPAAALECFCKETQELNLTYYKPSVAVEEGDNHLLWSLKKKDHLIEHQLEVQ